MHTLGPGSEIDGFRLGELIHVGSMASIYRLTGPAGPLPLIIKIPRLGPGERAVNVVAFEVCRMVLGALGQGPHHPTLSPSATSKRPRTSSWNISTASG